MPDGDVARDRSPRRSRRPCRTPHSCRRQRCAYPAPPGPSAIGRPDDQVVEAVAVDVAGRGDRTAGLIVRILPWITKPPVPSGDMAEIDRRAESAGLAEHHVAVAGIVARARRAGPSAAAPMIRSSKPSPLTSPAEETEQPDWSHRIRAVDHEAAGAARRHCGDRSPRRSRRPCRTPHSCRRHCAYPRCAGTVGIRTPR